MSNTSLDTNLQPLTGCFLFRYKEGRHKGAIYINIPKNASQSVRMALDCQQNWMEYLDINVPTRNLINGAGNIERFNDTDIQPESLSQCKKICVLRNPLYRVISVYQHILTLSTEGRVDTYPNHITQNSDFYKKNQNNSGENFNDEGCIEAFHLFLEFISHGNFYHLLTSPQIRFLRDKDLTIDNIDVFLTVENLEKDLKNLWEVMKIPFNFNVEHRNPTNTKIKEVLTPYIENNSEVRKKILGTYLEDKELYEKVTKQKLSYD